MKMKLEKALHTFTEGYQRHAEGSVVSLSSDKMVCSRLSSGVPFVIVCSAVNHCISTTLKTYFVNKGLLGS